MLKERIEMRPRVCNGKPVIKGTRIPVTVILEQLADGQSWDALFFEDPRRVIKISERPDGRHGNATTPAPARGGLGVEANTETEAPATP